MKLVDCADNDFLPTYYGKRSAFWYVFVFVFVYKQNNGGTLKVHSGWYYVERILQCTAWRSGFASVVCRSKRYASGATRGRFR